MRSRDGQSASVRYLDRIPAKGMFVVGADVVPGRYVCRAPGNGRWIRYPAGNAMPVAGRPDAPGEAEVVIEDGDIAFQTHMPGDWHRVGSPEAEPGDDGPGVEPVIDPDLGEHLVRRLRNNPDLLRHVRTGSPWAGERSRPRGADWLRFTGKEDMLLFGSSYPQWSTVSPDDLPPHWIPEQRAKVLGGNAAKLYGIKAPEAATA